MTISVPAAGSARPRGASEAARGEAGAGRSSPEHTGREHTSRGRAYSDALLARQQQRESSARTYARSIPIVPVRAQGTAVVGADGRRYLDCLAGAGSLALGHNHPVVVEAIQAVLASGAPLHTLDMATPVKDDFTEELLSTLPSELAATAKLHFCGPSGADAVEAAVKLTQTVTGRSTMLAFTGGYHGMTAGALALTGNVAVKDPLPNTGHVVRLPYPYPYRCLFGVGTGTRPTTDAAGGGTEAGPAAVAGTGPDGAELSARFVERLLDDPAGGVTAPAAMILEPVQGEGGVVPAPDDWLRRMRTITAERGIPLVLDEVQTGVGRTGTFWACERSGVTPDVLVMSKAIGGGLPLAVLAYRGELDGWAPGAHTGTFRGNQLAMAAGAATLRFVRTQGLADRARTLGGRLLDGLASIAAGRPEIGDVRGRGLMVGLELVDPDSPADLVGARRADPRLAEAVRRGCLDRGVIVELGGRLDAVVRLLPPLTISDDEVDTVLTVLAEALDAARRERRSRTDS